MDGLDFKAAAAYDGAHEIVGDKEADGSVNSGWGRDNGRGWASGDQLGDDKGIGLGDKSQGMMQGKQKNRRRAFATASTEPETVRTRSWTPGITLLTPALTPVCSRRSATFLPALPMMTPASFVLTRARRVRESWGGGEWEGEREGGWEDAAGTVSRGAGGQGGRAGGSPWSEGMAAAGKGGTGGVGGAAAADGGRGSEEGGGRSSERAVGGGGQ